MDQNTSDSLFGLHVDSEAVIQFREGTKWARFISVVSLAGILLVALIVTFAGASFKNALETYVPSMGSVDMDMLGNIFVVVVIIILAIVGFIYILLYRFAILVRKGIQQRNQEIFNDGLKYLKYYCIINGVIALLGIVFSFLGTIMELLK
jgi:hypothetical protein